MTPHARYQRQVLLPSIGEAGQRRLGESRALLVGCGALGCVIADALVRAGVGGLVIVDRDFVELVNLHRQPLYNEADAAEAMPKAEAARRRLNAVNHEVTVEAHPVDFTAANAERLAAGCGVLLDGTDNYETRLLLNDVAVKVGIPLVYGGAVGTTGTQMTVLPPAPAPRGAAPWGEPGPCLRCLFDAAPPPGTARTCDTAGVLAPVAALIASRQAVEAIKLLVGDCEAVDRSLLSIDAWANEHRRIHTGGMRDPSCPCCAERRFESLGGKAESITTVLCGRDAVQVTPAAPPAGLDFAALAERLRAQGDVRYNAFTLRATLTSNGVPRTLTLFTDGRAIVQGSNDPAAARALYARYIGA